MNEPPLRLNEHPNMLFRFQKCCYCIPLKAGATCISITLSIISLLFFIVSLIIITVDVHNEYAVFEQENITEFHSSLGNTFTGVATVSVVQLTANVFLFFGATQKTIRFIVIWLIFQFLLNFFYFILALWLLLAYINGEGSLIFIVFFLLLPPNIYVLLVVQSYYYELMDKIHKNFDDDEEEEVSYL